MEENININDKVNSENPNTLKNSEETSKADNNASNDGNFERDKIDIKEKKENNPKIQENDNLTIKSEIKPKKEIPIEKKPFKEFVINHLIPSIKEEFKQRDLDVEEIQLKNTARPISGDKCWVIYCSIKETCNFWLSFEKDDITSLKSISLSKPNQMPSIIESFLIDEKRITLKLITSRILQRLNGQKLIGFN